MARIMENDAKRNYKNKKGLLQNHGGLVSTTDDTYDGLRCILPGTTGHGTMLCFAKKIMLTLPADT